MKSSGSLLMSLGSKEHLDHLIADKGKISNWTVLKDARVGDQVLIYIKRPIREIVAIAEVRSIPERTRWNGKWHYMADIGPVEMLRSRISHAELRELFPDWKWLTQPRQSHRVPIEFAARLARRASLQTPRVMKAEVKVSGAGFGDAQTNREVEQAAIRAVTRRYRREGFKVRSVENEHCGYDLVATKGRSEWRIEVKGCSGSIIAFPITRNEVNAASDRLFRLAVVTNALSKSPTTQEYSGREFLQKFSRQVIAYMASLK